MKIRFRTGKGGKYPIPSARISPVHFGQHGPSKFAQQSRYFGNSTSRRQPRCPPLLTLKI